MTNSKAVMNLLAGGLRDWMLSPLFSCHSVIVMHLIDPLTAMAYWLFVFRCLFVFLLLPKSRN